jgi:hypothetical protein
MLYTESWAIPEIIHTPSTEEIIVVCRLRRGRGRKKNVCDNSNGIRTSEIGEEG